MIRCTGPPTDIVCIRYSGVITCRHLFLSRRQRKSHSISVQYENSTVMSVNVLHGSTIKECRPLGDLKELFDFKSLCCRCTSNPLRSIHEKLPSRSRVLLCHDFKGGYLLDKHHFDDASEVTDLPNYCASLDYRFEYWDKIDVFVYFSHNLVTIPPCSWIKQAHANGVKILGTFIIEWKPKIVDELLAPNNLPRIIKGLVEVCLETNFDGWLFNIEVDINQKQVEPLIHLVREVREQLIQARPGSLVIWYDSVTTSGKITYHDELVKENKPFFDVCDGIFLNYGWTKDQVKRSEALAGDRANDVYVGVDVFGRKTPYEAGFNSPKVAQEILSSSSCSVAIFAPGWVLECNDVEEFTVNQKRFWDKMPALKESTSVEEKQRIL
ncbi:cytosolic endo-beta-N-acetylglucosaminidase 1-like isoform X1 [Varroa destructor]|uniref:Cytosolic endo-beta-N-acetylglucosaminidase TIM barrel domain-containing protein n=1 Tax=Varroa destructor TaxID=109461 RepID=A0A7M7KVU0_VARDE|nr:cytosolic endo-beta-N-acetylglucosaminidase 1-like isoform X1 [Varroa destructor]